MSATQLQAPARPPESKGRPTAGRFAAITLGALLAAGTIGYSVLSAADWIVRHTTTSVAIYPARPALVIKTPGDVTVRAGAGSQIKVTTTSRSGLAGSQGQVSVDKDELLITGRCPVLSSACKVSYDVVVPADTRVTVNGQHVVVDGIAGAVLALSDANDIVLTNLSGVVEAHNSGGSISAVGLRSTDVTMSSSAGGVSLQFVAAPQHVYATSDAGDVAIYVPDDGRSYQVSARTTAGAERVSVRTDVNAASTIYAASSAGNVTVAYTTAVASQ